MIVVDASAVVDMLLRKQDWERIARRLHAERDAIHAPELIDVEVCHALRRMLLRGEEAPGRVQEAWADYLLIKLNPHAHRPLLPRIWELRHDLTAYDAAYLALAEHLAAPLLTRDRGFKRVPASIRVEVI